MRALAALLALFLIATSGMLVKVSIEIRKLRSQALQPSAAVVPKEFVPPLTLSTTSGDTVDLASGDPQTFLIFTTTCGFCDETIPIWREMLASRGNTRGIVAISLDSEEATRHYLESKPLPVPVVTMTEREKSLYGLGPVPHIMTINESGRIIYARTGSLAEVERAVLDSIENLSLK